MSPPAPTLAQILDDEAELYAEFLALLRQEETALIAGSGEFTARSLARKETLIVQIRLTELSRQGTLRRLTGQADTRLRDLPGAGSGELGRARSRLSTLLPQVAEAAGRVDVLLTRALARLHNTLDLIREAVGAGPHYTPEARLVQSPLPMLDGRA